MLSTKITDQQRNMIKEMREDYHLNVSSLIRDFIEKRYVQTKKNKQ